MSDAIKKHAEWLLAQAEAELADWRATGRTYNCMTFEPISVIERSVAELRRFLGISG